MHDIRLDVKERNEAIRQRFMRHIIHVIAYTVKKEVNLNLNKGIALGTNRSECTQRLLIVKRVHVSGMREIETRQKQHIFPVLDIFVVDTDFNATRQMTAPYSKRNQSLESLPHR